MVPSFWIVEEACLEPVAFRRETRPCSSRRPAALVAVPGTALDFGIGAPPSRRMHPQLMLMQHRR